MGDVLSWHYLLRGSIQSAGDSSIIDSVTVERRVQSSELKPYGATSFDTFYVADSGIYFIDLRARVPDDDAESVFDKSTFYFRFSKGGFVSRDTTLQGSALPKKKLKYREYEVTLPEVFLERDTTP